MRRILLLASTSALLLSMAPGAATAADPARDVVILTSNDLSYDRVPSHLDAALAWAQHRVSQEPTAYANAWYDGDTIVLDVLPGTATTDLPPHVTTRTVTHSYAELIATREHLTDMIATNPALDSAEAWIVFLDARSNRTVVGASSITDTLAELTQGTPSALTIMASPHSRPLSRDNDSTPFTAGSAISGPAGTCSSGFSWTGLGYSAQITAAHCAPSGGTVTVPSGTAGSVTAGSAENWTAGTGTNYFSGDTMYRGDIAVVATASGNTTEGKTYVGGTTSNTKVAIGGTWSRASAVNDTYCTGGASTGTSCTWTVTSVNANVLYSTGETVRNVAVGTSASFCLAAGDSGGPVYTHIPFTGKERAKGVISGGGTDGSTCTSVYTDITHVVAWFGGTAQTS